VKSRANAGKLLVVGVLVLLGAIVSKPTVVAAHSYQNGSTTSQTSEHTVQHQVNHTVTNDNGSHYVSHTVSHTVTKSTEKDKQPCDKHKTVNTHEVSHEVTHLVTHTKTPCPKHDEKPADNKKPCDKKTVTPGKGGVVEAASTTTAPVATVASVTPAAKTLSDTGTNTLITSAIAGLLLAAASFVVFRRVKTNV